VTGFGAREEKFKSRKVVGFFYCRKEKKKAKVQQDNFHSFSFELWLQCN
jgi:hypothetical protein